MHYKKVKENSILIFIDSIFRLFGFCWVLAIEDTTGEIKDVYLKSSHTSHKPR